MIASEIRQKWLDFFMEKGHKIEPSASLVPHKDPTLLWINAGMAPLKSYFDGREKPENPRIANSQKCIRTNDIENVGKTRRHHTFFEMLGNFSIGDYFKEEAITWAWEFLTDPKWIGFEPHRISVTVHFEDEEAYRLWHEKIGISAERIYKLDKDNFWDIGEGPCGPCTEIFYDRGDAYGDLSDAECWPGGENERFLEVWNLVFSQFNHNKDGSYTPLPNKNIDTGAGLERFAAIMQNVDSNFDTDLFQPIIQAVCNRAGLIYHVNEEHDIALKVIADHIRTVVFSVGDGVLPSNEGRGYIIRRLLRRAVRYGKVLGIEQPFLHQLTAIVGKIMGGYYPEIIMNHEFIEKVIRSEEVKFHETLSDGLTILADLTTQAKANNASQLSGAEAFKLYDTYGFPLDLTEDYALEHGLSIDRAGFDLAMEAQRTRARAARHENESMKIQGGPLLEFTGNSEFVGYNEWETESKVIAIVRDQQFVDLASEGDFCQIILDKTPFYAESGGQISDRGWLNSNTAKISVEEVGKAPRGQIVHSVYVESGEVRVGDMIEAAVNRSLRDDIIKNHTATHLLHQALKDVLGKHVNQAGSLVAPERLRFDFSHFGSISATELQDIEQLVNRQIWQETLLNITLKPIDEAKAMGAMALFGEKYGNIVRVVQIGDYSIELCGGCHVMTTSQIGIFKIVSESGIGSGVRRIEAVTGRHAYEYMQQQLELLQQSALMLKGNIVDVPKRIEGLQAQVKESGRTNEVLLHKLSHIEANHLASQLKHIAGIPLIVAKAEAEDMNSLRMIVDELKMMLKSVIIVLASHFEDKLNFVAAVTPDLLKQGFHAGNIVKAAASQCGGSGGGRPDMAQAGGKDVGRLSDAMRCVEQLIAEQKSAALKSN